MEPVIQSISAVERPPSPGGARTLARFTVQLGDVRLYGLLLREFPDGTRRTIAPNVGGQHCASFQPAIAEKITKAASKALAGGQIADSLIRRTA
ncbi:hypothetical protein [Sinorhizobium medicae]|uniref:hypothetical protein n=1 Tax=Sinorhizobium medicae TaxID=110321 RepID=UPI000C7CB643|nr:hypothetical protein [Sinorhizobium medicae]MDX0426821.1 hypothetical protein [Sinorhizobium medicae]PLU02323.1 hypothetical protein BMJ32_12925 [Sinorhizobium medicae]PLU64536.1 hypothetical protein BMJ21_22995 [Sinorhizobium medicae]TWA22757.1 hypothetical protein FB006_10947 [Sinorhizobium medicae]TWA43055.1 hypothetical protein FB005_10947 [Sinorhizobium medicae]